MKEPPGSSPVLFAVAVLTGALVLYITLLIYASVKGL